MKKNLLLIFGGQSSEHDVSCLSAYNVIQCINREKYELCLVGITRDGHWLFTDDAEKLKDGTWEQSSVSAVLSPDSSEKCLYLMSEHGTEKVKPDVIYPVLHGLYGEDGTIQGLFELADIPYVGCNVLSSAASMDKSFTKIVVDTLGIRQAAYVLIRKQEMTCLSDCIRRVEEKIPYPVFVKPACAGSSKGVSKASDREELEKALLEAVKHDTKILVEETIVGRELECAVFGDDLQIQSSNVGEVLAAAEFYDFDAKYHNAESRTDTNPDLPTGVLQEIREDAEKIFRALDCYSMSRVDFFLDEKGVVFNEINTLPGFTAISMYPMLFEAIGVSKEELVDRLIETAFTRQGHFDREGELL